MGKRTFAGDKLQLISNLGVKHVIVLSIGEHFNNNPLKNENNDRQRAGYNAFKHGNKAYDMHFTVV